MKAPVHQPLHEVCRKFIAQCETAPSPLVDLEHSAKTLGTELKRLQDVVNTLMGFSVISRRSKSSYEWKGLQRAQDAIHEIESGAQNSAPATPVSNKSETTAAISTKVKIKLLRKIKPVAAEDSESCLLNLTRDCLYRPKTPSMGQMCRKLAGVFAGSKHELGLSNAAVIAFDCDEDEPESAYYNKIQINV